MQWLPVRDTSPEHSAGEYAPGIPSTNRSSSQQVRWRVRCERCFPEFSKARVRCLSWESRFHSPSPNIESIWPVCRTELSKHEHPKVGVNLPLFFESDQN